MCHPFAAHRYVDGGSGDISPVNTYDGLVLQLKIACVICREDAAVQFDPNLQH